MPSPAKDGVRHDGRIAAHERRIPESIDMVANLDRVSVTAEFYSATHILKIQYAGLRQRNCAFHPHAMAVLAVSGIAQERLNGGRLHLEGIAHRWFDHFDIGRSSDKQLISHQLPSRIEDNAQHAMNANFGIFEKLHMIQIREHRSRENMDLADSGEQLKCQNWMPWVVPGTDQVDNAVHFHIEPLYLAGCG